jgi:hypothetical protein
VAAGGNIMNLPDGPALKAYVGWSPHLLQTGTTVGHAPFSYRDAGDAGAADHLRLGVSVGGLPKESSSENIVMVLGVIKPSSPRRMV